MNRFVVVLLFLLALISPVVSAETIIYDSITTSQYNFITLNDDLNIAFINDYEYDVYLNGSFFGSFVKGEKIPYSDGMNITIYVPTKNINTDAGALWDIGRTNFYIAVMFMGTGLLGVLVIGFVVYRLFGRKRR